MFIVQILVALVFILVALWLITLCLRLGAGWAGVTKRQNTIGRALVAMILCWLLLTLLGLGGGIVMPIGGNLLGLILAFALNGAVVSFVYEVKFMKGVQICLLANIAAIVIGLIAIVVFGLLGLSLAL